MQHCYNIQYLIFLSDFGIKIYNIVTIWQPGHFFTTNDGDEGRRPQKITYFQSVCLFKVSSGASSSGTWLRNWSNRCFEGSRSSMLQSFCGRKDGEKNSWTQLPWIFSGTLQDVLGDSLPAFRPQQPPDTCSLLHIKWLLDHSLSLRWHKFQTSPWPRSGIFSEVSNSSEALSASKSAGTNLGQVHWNRTRNL